MKRQEREAAKARMRDSIKRRKDQPPKQKQRKRSAPPRYIPAGPFRVWVYIEGGIKPEGECPDIVPDSYAPISGYFETVEEAEKIVTQLRVLGECRPVMEEEP